MAALASFTIADFATVNHTYTPVSHSPTNATFRETGLSSSLAAGVISLDKLRVKGNGGMEKYRVKLYQPVLEADLAANAEGYTAAPKVAYSLNLSCEFTAPLRATEAQRKDVIALGKSALGSNITVIYDALVSGIMPY
jgi:hypothetical protein